MTAPTPQHPGQPEGLVDERDRRVDQLRDQVFQYYRRLYSRWSGSPEEAQDFTIGLAAAFAMWATAVCAPDATPEEIGRKWGDVLADFVGQCRAEALAAQQGAA